MGSAELEQVTKATYENRVETILIEENRILPGKVNRNTGKIEIGEIDNPDMGDILDELAELVLVKGGNVVIISKDKMPSLTGIAAIYRYN
jgi:stalled ribosome rescue protein Dom34